MDLPTGVEFISADVDLDALLARVHAIDSSEHAGPSG
jgi:hypothetical protein